MDSDPIVNRVAQSGIISLNLEEILKDLSFTSIDLSDQLWQGIALKEQDFRAWVKENDWTVYQDQYVNVYCSADAIIPAWAYMLVASKLSGSAACVYQQDPVIAKEHAIRDFIFNLPLSTYEDARVVVKGCAEEDIPVSAYVAVVSHLQPVVRTLLFGEPCSTVPVYKKPRK